MLLRHRVAAASLLVLAAFVTLVPAVPAGAAKDTGTEIYPGWKFTGATVTAPGKPPRHFDSRQTVAFVQSWYIATILSATTSLTEEHPPPDLPVSTFKATDTITGAPYTFIAYYVTNGNKAWVGLPKQAIGPGAVVPAEKWWIAPTRAILAWEGKTGPELPPAPTTTTTTTPPATSKDKSSSHTAVWIFVVGGAIVVVAIGLVLVTRRRAKAGSKRPG